MLAVASALCFLLKLLKVDTDIDLIALGLFFLALHIVLPIGPAVGPIWYRRDPPNA